MSRPGSRLDRLVEYGRAHPLRADAALALGLAVLSLPDVFHLRNQPVLPLVFHLALWGVLIFRRVAPGWVFAVLAAIAAVQWLTGVAVTADLALLVALYTVAAHRPRSMAFAAAGVLELGVVLAALRWAPTIGPLRVIVVLTTLVAATVLLGITQQARRAHLAALVDRATRLELERDRQAELATAAERTRIAREMHDIVAHSLSVMISLADGAALTDRSADAQAAMRQVSRTGRDALADTRRVLGVLRAGPEPADRAPQPGLDGLDALLTAVRATGLRAELAVSGTVFPLGSTAEGAVYRIVQEALTNTVKHAPRAARVVVRLSYHRPNVSIDIVDDGAGTGVPVPVPPGSHGLTGIRERAALYGGDLVAGPRRIGGWQVHTELLVADADGDS